MSQCRSVAIQSMADNITLMILVIYFFLGFDKMTHMFCSFITELLLNFGNNIKRRMVKMRNMIIYKYDIPVGSTTAIIPPREDCNSRASLLFRGDVPVVLPTGMSYLFYYTEQNTKQKRGKMTNTRYFG